MSISYMIMQKRYRESVSPDPAVESGLLAMVDGVYIVTPLVPYYWYCLDLPWMRYPVHCLKGEARPACPFAHVTSPLPL